MSLWLSLVIAAAASYLLGNLNGSVLISRLHEHDDVRLHGSGNAGFTNFFRNYGGLVSLIVILVDGFKAAAACLISGALLRPFGLQAEGAVLGAVCVTLGHNFPALLGFRGGKGIVCGFASAIVIDWRVALIIFLVFSAFYLSTHYVSLASILAAFSFGAAFLVLHWGEFWICAGGVFLSLLAIFMHRQNLLRLLRGEETKTDFFHRREKK